MIHIKPLIHISTRNTALRGVKSILKLWNWRTQTSGATNTEFLNLPTKSPKLCHHNHWSLQFDSTLNNINWACSLTIQSPKSTLVLSLISLSLSLSWMLSKENWKYSSSLSLHAYRLPRTYKCFILYNDRRHNTLNTKELPSFCIFSIPQPAFLHVLQSSVQNNITKDFSIRIRGKFHTPVSSIFYNNNAQTCSALPSHPYIQHEALSHEGYISNVPNAHSREKNAVQIFAGYWYPPRSFHCVPQFLEESGGTSYSHTLWLLPKSLPENNSLQHNLWNWKSIIK